MQTTPDLAKKAMQAGVFLAHGGMFMNSPDVVQEVVASNTVQSGTVTLSQGSLNPWIIGVTVLNGTTTLCVINDVASNNYYLKQPIVAELRQDDDAEWIATFAEAELSRSGETVEEALDWLKASVVELYELFAKETRLGPLPKKQLKALRQYLGKKPHRAR